MINEMGHHKNGRTTQSDDELIRSQIQPGVVLDRVRCMIAKTSGFSGDPFGRPRLLVAFLLAFLALLPFVAFRPIGHLILSLIHI